MGTIVRVAGADYSQNAVGKYDFEREVYRTKKEDGTFEKYAFYPLFGRVAMALSPNVNILDGASEVDFQLDFKYTMRTTIKQIFGYTEGNQSIMVQVNDSTKRIMLSIHNHNAGGKSLNVEIDYTMISDMQKIGETSIIGSDYSLKFKIIPNQGGTTMYKFGTITLNGHVNTAPVTEGATAIETRTKMIAIGKTAPGSSNNNNTAGTCPWFIGIKKNNEPIVLFDFMGSSELEKFTDKKSGIVLVKEGDYSVTPAFLSVL